MLNISLKVDPLGCWQHSIPLWLLVWKPQCLVGSLPCGPFQRVTLNSSWPPGWPSKGAPERIWAKWKSLSFTTSSWKWQKDTDENQQREESHKAGLGATKVQSFWVFPPWGVMVIVSISLSDEVWQGAWSTAIYGSSPKRSCPELYCDFNTSIWLTFHMANLSLPSPPEAEEMPYYLRPSLHHKSRC